MKFVFYCFFCSLPFVSTAQSSRTEILTDTTMAIGVIAEDCFVGKSISSYCINGSDKEFSVGDAVLISGIQKCTKSYSNETTQFFEIKQYKNTYYIERSKLLINATFFEQIENMPTERSQAFKENAQNISELLYRGEVRKALKFLDNCKSKGLAVLDWSHYDESEYTEGTSIKIQVYNPTSKTIKYLWFSFVGFNPVGDRIISRKTGTGNIIKKAVGPIEPNENGSYEFSYAWFTDLVETARIVSIKVQYMDNSIKIIQNPQSTILPNQYYKFLFDEE
jgi:hypothetical protein